eukprot:1710374-Pleurochrysis_carterae.AAC.1
MHIAHSPQRHLRTGHLLEEVKAFKEWGEGRRREGENSVFCAKAFGERCSSKKQYKTSKQEKHTS